MRDQAMKRHQGCFLSQPLGQSLESWPFRLSRDASTKGRSLKTTVIYLHVPSENNHRRASPFAHARREQAMQKLMLNPSTRQLDGKPSISSEWSGLPKAIASQLLARATPRCLKAGDVLFEAGDEGDGCCRLDKG